MLTGGQERFRTHRKMSGAKFASDCLWSPRVFRNGLVCVVENVSTLSFRVNIKLMTPDTDGQTDEQLQVV